MEHRYVERIRTGSQMSATHQQEQAQSYVRTAVEHKKAIVENKAFRYEVEAKEACNAYCKDLTERAREFERSEMQASHAAANDSAQAKEGLRKANAETSSSNLKYAEVRDQVYPEAAAMSEAASQAAITI